MEDKNLIEWNNIFQSLSLILGQVESENNRLQKMSKVAGKMKHTSENMFWLKNNETPCSRRYLISLIMKHHREEDMRLVSRIM